MATPYSGVNITGYNSNPPADDGSQTEANRVKWATIKTKLNDPVKTRTDDINTALIAAFGKIDGGITSTGVNYTVLSPDQGKLVRATVASITITTPDATDVGSPFVFGVLNDSTGDITLDGSGSQTIDGDASVTIPAGAGCRIRTDGTNWFTEGQSFQRTQVVPQGYLTLIAEASNGLSPIPSSDQSAATAVYYRPDVGNLLPIPDGTNFSVREFSELTLTLNSNHVASGIYDCFVWDDAGTLRVGTGPVWTTATAGSGARGTGAGTTELQKLKGLAVNKLAITLRNGATTYSVSAKCAIFVGSIYIDGSAGQVTCHVTAGQSRKWGVSNAYNKRRINLMVSDSTATWTYNSATVRQSNGAAGNKATVFSCIAEDKIEIRFSQNIDLGGSGSLRDVSVGIGVDSTTTVSGKAGYAGFNAASGISSSTLYAEHLIAAGVLGISNINSLESSPSGAGATHRGGQDDMQMVVSFMA